MNTLTIDQVVIGQEFIHSELGTVSTVIDKTATSVELYNRTDPNNRYATGEKDAEGIPQLSGRRKGINGKNWYTLRDFNKLFNEIRQ